jgi:hypothetical protein
MTHDDTHDVLVQRRTLPRMLASGTRGWIGPDGFLLDASLAGACHAAQVAGAGIERLPAAA